MGEAERLSTVVLLAISIAERPWHILKDSCRLLRLLTERKFCLSSHLNPKRAIRGIHGGLAGPWRRMAIMSDHNC